MAQLYRKHFAEAARIINELGGENRDKMAQEFATLFRSTHSEFNRQRFVDACTVEPEADDIITVYRYERLTNSVNGCPRFKLFCDGETLVTSSDASCNYGIENGWTVNHVTKESRQARITRTRAGRIETLEWLDGDH